MQSQSLSGRLLLSLFVLLSLGTAVAPCGRDQEGNAARTQGWTAMNEDGRDTHRRRFDCLPKDVRLNEVVAYAGATDGNVTVEKTLVEIKAQCRKGKLIDRKRREIRFFRPACWGNPPQDYREIKRRENEELRNLQEHYTVIVFACSPMIQ
jgi:hypothetical protein